MANKPDGVELELLCAKVCRTPDWVTNGKGSDEPNQTVRDEINQLTL